MAANATACAPSRRTSPSTGPAFTRCSRTASGVDAVDAVAAVPGLAGLHVGPVDLGLGLGLGLGGDRSQPPFATALKSIVAAGHRAGLPVTMHAVGPDQVAGLIELGFDELVLTTDIELLRSAFAERVAQARGLAATPAAAPYR